MQTITTTDIKDVLAQTLPAQNNFGETDYIEVRDELIYFGVTTKVALLDLIVKHREAVQEID